MEQIVLTIVFGIAGIVSLVAIYHALKGLFKRVFSKETGTILMFIVMGLVQICTILAPIVIVAVGIKLLF